MEKKVIMLYLKGNKSSAIAELTIKTKSSSYSQYYVEACNEWRVRLRGLAPGQHSSKETLQQWQAVDNYPVHKSNLSGPKAHGLSAS